uniref:Uncharacterized protein n=1 Tax=Plectus sambesii TaxID=2011161 RepID=A0A914WTQ9_9BILA
MSRFTAVIFLAVCLLGLYQTVNANVIPQPAAGATDVKPPMMGEGRGISWECTAKCTAFWACKAQCFFMCHCDVPSGCDCNNFGR